MACTADSRCPVCRAALWAPNSEPISQRSCPRCGAELWALAGTAGPMFFTRRPGESERRFLAALVGPLHGMSTPEMEAVLATADALDLVELVMELDEAMRKPCATREPPKPS